MTGVKSEQERGERERASVKFSGVDLHFNLHPMQPNLYIGNSSSFSTVLPGVDNSRIPNS